MKKTNPTPTAHPKATPNPTARGRAPRPSSSNATGVPYDTIERVHRRAFIHHPLGLPNPMCSCFQVTTHKGKALFAIARYAQRADPNIISITRMLYPDQNASHFLAVFRKHLRHQTRFRAATTWTHPADDNTHLQDDRWVYLVKHANRKHWIRTL